MKWKCLTHLLVVLVAAAIQLPAQQSESDRKSFEEDKAGAEKGDAAAQHNLGVCYANGQGVAKDTVEAVKWFRKAAEQNFASAQYNLGNCYYNGQGVAMDAVEAVKWYRKAAEQNDAGAQYNLGSSYATGQGVAKNEVETVKWYRKAAEQNYAAAQFNLGVCFKNGEGVAKDAVEAVKWFRKAAEQNYAGAQYNLGNCYYNGQGVAKDAVTAVKWYRKAAEQNYAEAQYNLGVCFKSGEGVAKDAVEAVRWWRKAAEQNLATAQDNLGLCYANGGGVAKDAVEAAKWFRKAAEQNYAPAQVNMSACYVGGQGVATNYVEAYKWRLLAARQGDEMAKKTLTILEKFLSREQVAEGQKLARNFKWEEGMKSDKQIGESVSGWKRYSSQAGGFSIEFPESPETETVRGRMNDTRFQDVYLLKAKKSEAAYSAAYSDEFDDILKQFSVDQILDAARDGALANTQGKLLYELAISKDGFQGREIVFLASGLSSRVRIYLVGNRKYVLGVAGQGAKDAKATTVFLNSFQFISKETSPR